MLAENPKKSYLRWCSTSCWVLFNLKRAKSKQIALGRWNGANSKLPFKCSLLFIRKEAIGGVRRKILGPNHFYVRLRLLNPNDRTSVKNQFVKDTDFVNFYGQRSDSIKSSNFTSLKRYLNGTHTSPPLFLKVIFYALCCQFTFSTIGIKDRIATFATTMGVVLNGEKIGSCSFWFNYIESKSSNLMAEALPSFFCHGVETPASQDATKSPQFHQVCHLIYMYFSIQLGFGNTASEIIKINLFCDFNFM